MKKRIALFVYGSLWPVGMGSQRVIVEIAKYLHSLPDVSLKIVTIADARHEAEYRAVCDDVVFVPPVGRWSFWSLLNKVGSRLGIDVFRSFFSSLAYRKKVAHEMKDCDYVFVNYVVWRWLLPRSVISDKTMVITHDLLFYRRASFSPPRNVLTKFWFDMNRKLEFSVLRQFDKIGVFANYEKRLLMDAGFMGDDIVELGMPISVQPPKDVPLEYDFIFVGGNSYQNEAGIRCFFERVVPLLDGIDSSLVVVGGICNSTIWSAIDIPKTLRVTRMGYVNDVSDVMSRSLIGVGTVPFGSGVKVKVVESIMFGLPMVLTNSGVEGIPVLPEAVINIDSEASTDVRIRLASWLNNRSQTRILGRRAAHALSEKFSPNVALKRISCCFAHGGLPCPSKNAIILGN